MGTWSPPPPIITKVKWLNASPLPRCFSCVCTYIRLLLGIRYDTIVKLYNETLALLIYNCLSLLIIGFFSTQNTLTDKSNFQFKFFIVNFKVCNETYALLLYNYIKIVDCFHPNPFTKLKVLFCQFKFSLLILKYAMKHMHYFCIITFKSLVFFFTQTHLHNWKSCFVNFVFIVNLKVCNKSFAFLLYNYFKIVIFSIILAQLIVLFCQFQFSL